SLLKIDSSGNPLWAKSYGGSDDEYGSYIVQTSDNGYLISGTTRSFGGWDETYLVRIDSIGNVVWSKIIDNTTASGSYNSMVPIIKTTDGNFLVGTTFPNSTYPSYDACFVKIDQAGNILWKNAFGKHVLNYHETITSIEELSSGGFAAGGFTNFLELIKDDLYLAVLNDIGKVGCNDYEPNIFMVNTSTISSAITPTSANISLSVSPLTVVPSVPTTTETNTCVIIAEANFIANDSTIMTGSTIQFTDLSPNSVVIL
ncbi:MAG: hypothetical protein HY738_12650, partial [Bacteroidia bacterium]|nr:hypothetical protein [Bacteroidia bacterium]